MAKPVIASDESVNQYGYRVLTKGIDTTYFEANPIMLYNHRRNTSGYTGINDTLPVGKWVNIRIEGKKLVMEPEFDVDDEFAMKLAGKWEKGYLNAASINFDFIELSEDPDLLESGQIRPTVTKSILSEVSITDIPGNRNCTKLSYRGKSLLLNGTGQDANDLDAILPTISSTKSINSKMDKKLLLTTLGLPEDTTDMALLGKLTEMSNNSARLAAENLSLTAKLAALEKEQTDGKVKMLVADAVKAGKLTAIQAPVWESLAAKDFEGTKLALEGMQGYVRPNEAILLAAGGSSTALDAQALSDADEYRKLDKEGKLAALASSDNATFQRLYDAYVADLERRGKVKRK